MTRSHAEQSPIRTPLWWVMRGVWACLAALHLWPFAVLVHRLFTTTTVADAFWLASLVGVTVVFALKAVDSARLRFHRPGVEFTVFVIVAALIHGGAVTRQSFPALAIETATTAVVACGGVVFGSRRLRRRMAELLRGFAGRLFSLGHDIRRGGFAHKVAWDCPNEVVRCCAPARAPPSLIF